MTKELILKTKKVDIKPRNLSDHCPIIWHSKDITKVSKFWRINKDLLGKQNAVDYLKKEIEEYFKQNETPEINRNATIWDAFKAVSRGLLINLNIIEKKKKEEKTRQIHQELEKTELELKKKKLERRNWKRK